MQIAKELQETLEFYKNGGAEGMALAPEVTKDLQIASGLQAYNLLPTALTLYPALTPLRNITPRLEGRGKQSEFKAIVGLSGDVMANIWGSEGNSGAKVDIQTADIIAVYRSLKEATGVSFEQQWAGQGFIDSKSTAVVNLLRQFMIQEEQSELYGLNSAAASNQFGPGAVGTPGAATLAAIAAPTGFSSNLGAGSLFVKYTAVTGMGESLPSAEQSVAVTAGQAVSITFPARSGKPVLYYKIYTSQATGTEKLNTVAALTNGVAYLNGTGTPIAAGVVGGAVVSTGAPLVVGAVGSGANVPGADATASALAYNGLFAQLYGSSTYPWPAVSTPMASVGATIQSANAQLATSGSGTNAIEAFLAAMWQNAAADPDWFMLHQQEARKITALTLGQGTPYFLVPQGAPSDTTANFRVSRYVNPVTGKEIVLKAHPYFKQGSIVAGQDSLPSWYVPTEIPAPMALDMLQDYTEVDYPPKYATDGTGDTWIVEVLNMGTFKLFIPPLFGVLDSIIPG